MAWAGSDGAGEGGGAGGMTSPPKGCPRARARVTRALVGRAKPEGDRHPHTGAPCLTAELSHGGGGGHGGWDIAGSPRPGQEQGGALRGWGRGGAGWRTGCGPGSPAARCERIPQVPNLSTLPVPAPQLHRAGRTWPLVWRGCPPGALSQAGAAPGLGSPRRSSWSPPLVRGPGEQRRGQEAGRLGAGGPGIPAGGLQPRLGPAHSAVGPEGSESPLTNGRRVADPSWVGRGALPHPELQGTVTRVGSHPPGTADGPQAAPRPAWPTSAVSAPRVQGSGLRGLWDAVCLAAREAEVGAVDPLGTRKEPGSVDRALGLHVGRVAGRPVEGARERRALLPAPSSPRAFSAEGERTEPQDSAVINRV